MAESDSIQRDLFTQEQPQEREWARARRVWKGVPYAKKKNKKRYYKNAPNLSQLPSSHLIAPTPLERDRGVPVGYCQCGCGAKTSIAKKTDKRDGSVKGQPTRFVTGSHSRRRRLAEYAVLEMGHVSPCWIWAGAIGEMGDHSYGITWHPRKKVRAPAHRVYYEMQVGPIPVGCVLDHLCRQPLCVRPDHLDPVTQLVNVQRGRAAKLSVADVIEIRRLYLKERLPKVVIAARYGIAASTVYDVGIGRTWANIPFDADA